MLIKDVWVISQWGQIFKTLLKLLKILEKPPIPGRTQQAQLHTKPSASNSAVFILSLSPILLTSRPTTLNVLFPSVPSPSPSFHYCPNHSFIHLFSVLSTAPGNQRTHSSLSLCLSLSPSLPGLIRGPHTPSSHPMSGNWRWDCFGGGGEARTSRVWLCAAMQIRLSKLHGSLHYSMNKSRH